MARQRFHISCYVWGIYAGIYNIFGQKWLVRDDVTKEAIEAVRDYLYYIHISENVEGVDRERLTWKMDNGDIVSLVLTVQKHRKG